MNENADMLVTVGLDYGPAVAGMTEFSSRMTAQAAALDARLSALGKGSLGSELSSGLTTIGTKMEGLSTRSQTLLNHLDRMSNVFTGGLGIGIAVGGFALLERAFDRAIAKAREFQTAQISIAATMSSSGYRTDLKGNRLGAGDAFSANLKYAQDLQARLLAASAKNHLTFQEQLGAFQSSLATGLNKGMNIDQIFKISDLGAMAAKSLGLRGEQIANATRLLMGGGVNVARSTIGRALGISNTDITARSGDTLTKFLEIKLKGFDAAQSEFGSSIEGVVSTLRSKLDTMLAKVGMNFFNAIKPALLHIIDATERPEFQKGGKEHANETMGDYKKRYDTYLQGQVTQDKLVDSLSKGFEGLYGALEKIVNSGAFDAFLQFLVTIADNAQTIALAAVFTKIGTSIKWASEQAKEFAASLVKVDAAEALGAGGRGGNLRNAGSVGRGAASEGSALEQMMSARGMTTTDMRRELQDKMLQEFVPLPNSPGSKAKNAQRFAEHMLSRANAAQTLEELGMMVPPAKAGLLSRLGAGASAATSGVSTWMGNLINRSRLATAGLAGETATALEGMGNRLPIGIMGLLGSSMITGDSLGARAGSGALAGAGIGYTLGGGPGAAIGALVDGVLTPAFGTLADASNDAAKALHALADTQENTPGGSRVSQANTNYRRRTRIGRNGLDLGTSEQARQDAVTDELNSPDLLTKGVGILGMLGKLPLLNLLGRGSATLGEHFSGVNYNPYNLVSTGRGNLAAALAQKREIAQATDISKYKGYFNQDNATAAVLTARGKNLKEYASGTEQQSNVKVNAEEVKRFLAKGIYQQFLMDSAKGLVTTNDADIDQMIVASVTNTAKYKALGKSEANEPRRAKMIDEAFKHYEVQQQTLRIGAVNERELGIGEQKTATQTGEKLFGANMEKAKEFVDTFGSIWGQLVDGAKNLAEVQQEIKGAFAKTLRTAQENAVEIAATGVRQRKAAFDLGTAEAKFVRDMPLERAKAAMQPEIDAEKQRQYQLKGVGLGLERAEYGLSQEDLNLADQQADLSDKERALKREEITDTTRRLAIATKKRERAYGYEVEDRPLEQEKADIGVSKAAGAETLFYGGMGPVSKIAAAIRYKVEASYAGRFNPIEYEAALRQQFDNEIEEMRVAKIEAARKAQRQPAEFAEQDTQEQEALTEDKRAKEKIAQENAGANLADLTAAQQRKHLALNRQKNILEGLGLGEKAAEYATEGKQLAVEIGLSSHAMEDYNNSVKSAMLGFVEQELNLKKSNMVYEDMIEAQVALVQQMKNEQKLHGEKGNVNSAIPDNSYAAGREKQFANMDKAKAKAIVAALSGNGAPGGVDPVTGLPVTLGGIAPPAVAKGFSMVLDKIAQDHLLLAKVQPSQRSMIPRRVNTNRGHI